MCVCVHVCVCVCPQFYIEADNSSKVGPSKPTKANKRQSNGHGNGGDSDGSDADKEANDDSADKELDSDHEDIAPPRESISVPLLHTSAKVTEEQGGQALKVANVSFISEGRCVCVRVHLC